MTENESESDCYPPWNFSWIVKNELALMGCPGTSANVNYIIKQDIKHLVTLSPEKLPDIQTLSPTVEWIEIPVEEFKAPKIEQIIRFIDICQQCRIKKQVSTQFYFLSSLRNNNKRKTLRIIKSLSALINFITTFNSFSFKSWN